MLNEMTRAAPPICAVLATLESGLGTDAVEAVRAVLSQPDDRLDYAQAKLALDVIVDPTLNADAAMSELDGLADVALGLAGSDASVDAKLSALRKLIYESGPWNENRPFAYDRSDPDGQSIRARLISHYLATRLGNCISMPILFLILAEKLNIDLALVAAPLHLFLRYQDERGRVVNLEATSGAHPMRDEWIRRNFPMTDRALETGIYMRTLTRREGIAHMAGSVVEVLIHEGRYQEAAGVCQVILSHDPRDVHAMAKLGTACGLLIRAEFESKYRMPILIPPALRPRYLMLARWNHQAFAAAEALGWEGVEL